jgi:gamma-glutamylcyclotransferase (GGCT)/AIG2-like uncharacterized protein YtfP
MTDAQHVFVYGLLMRGCSLHTHMEAASFEGTATVRGELLSFGRYPGLVNGSGTVRGEVYRFHDLAAALDILDDIEEFDPTDPEDSLYVREVRDATMDEGGVVRAWVYVYNGLTDGAVKIPSGDWRTQ